MTTLEKVHRLKEAVKLIREVLDSESMYYADDVMKQLDKFIETLQRRLKGQ